MFTLAEYRDAQAKIAAGEYTPMQYLACLNAGLEKDGVKVIAVPRNAGGLNSDGLTRYTKVDKNYEGLAFGRALFFLRGLSFWQADACKNIPAIKGGRQSQDFFNINNRYFMWGPGLPRQRDRSGFANDPIWPLPRQITITEDGKGVYTESEFAKATTHVGKNYLKPDGWTFPKLEGERFIIIPYPTRNRNEIVESYIPFRSGLDTTMVGRPSYIPGDVRELFFDDLLKEGQNQPARLNHIVSVNVAKDFALGQFTAAYSYSATSLPSSPSGRRFAVVSEILHTKFSELVELVKKAPPITNTKAVMRGLLPLVVSMPPRVDTGSLRLAAELNPRNLEIRLNTDPVTRDGDLFPPINDVEEVVKTSEAQHRFLGVTMKLSAQNDLDEAERQLKAKRAEVERYRESANLDLDKTQFVAELAKLVETESCVKSAALTLFNPDLVSGDAGNPTAAIVIEMPDLILDKTTRWGGITYKAGAYRFPYAGLMVPIHKVTAARIYSVLRDNSTALEKDRFTSRLGYPHPHVYRDGRVCWAETDLDRTTHFNEIEQTWALSVSDYIHWVRGFLLNNYTASNSYAPVFTFGVYVDDVTANSKIVEPAEVA